VPGGDPRPASPLKRWVARGLIVVGALPLGLFLWACYRSYRFVHVEGAGHLDALAQERAPILGACWHNRMFVCGSWFLTALRRAGRGMAVLVSLSRDGDLAATLARMARVHVVRGSTTRGGTEGLYKLTRVVRRRGLSTFTAPDGPQGPVYVCKPGTLVLARTTGAPILPLAFAADRTWRFGSWDRLVLPRPLARVAFVVGEPLRVPPGAGEGELAALTVELERRLRAGVRACEAALGLPSEIDEPAAPA